MTATIVYDPLIPLSLLIVVTIIALMGVIIAILRGLNGWPLRALAALVVLGALANPSYQQEDRAPLSDIVLLVEDESASQRLSDRPQQTSDAATALAAQITARPNTEIRRITVPDGAGDAGTEMMAAITDALAEEPRARIAGILAISDGRVHDADLPLDLPAPMHLLMTGKQADWDRLLTVRNAPAFAIIGEPVTLTLRIDDLGAAPAGETLAPLDISIDGEEPLTFSAPSRRGADRSQQFRTDPDERGARPFARAAGQRRAASRRAHMAQPAEIGQFGRSGAFYHPAPPRKARRCSRQ
jgi:hypothetical protein